MKSLFKFRVALLVATFCAGCSPDGQLEWDVGANSPEHEGLEARADAEARAQLRDAVVTVDGRVVGQVAAVHHNDKTSEVALTFVGGVSDDLFARVASEIRGDKVDTPDIVLTGLDEGDQVAEITIVNAHAKEITFDELSAQDGKAMFRCTMTFASEEVKHAYDTSALAAPSQGDGAASEVDVAGLAPEVLEGFTLRARAAAAPVDGEASWVVDALTVTTGPDGYYTASALVAAGEVLPVTILITDGATGRRTKITTRGKPVKATRKPLQCTIDFAIEQQYIHIHQEA